MPVITIEAGKLSEDQKRTLVAELTASASTIMRAPESAFIVLIKELEKENIGFGGELLSDH